MKDFFHYFFSKGDTQEFYDYSFAHFAPILVAALLIFLIYRKRDALLSRERLDYNIRMAMAFTMIVSEMSYFWRLVGVSGDLNPNAVDHLPITICGWGIVLGSYMLATKSQKLFDIVYFWVFAGTIFALITPTVIAYTGPTRYRYYQFWIEHLMGYIAVFYMIFVHKMRPTIKSAVRAYGWLAVLAVIAYVANVVIGPGANYLFMARPEDTPGDSITKILPENMVLRLFIMAAVVTALFLLSYLPWLLMDYKKKKSAVVEEIAAAEDKELIEV